MLQLQVVLQKILVMNVLMIMVSPSTTIKPLVSNALPPGCSFKTVGSFVKAVCPEGGIKCPFSHMLYNMTRYDDLTTSYSNRCPLDDFFYQACFRPNFDTINIGSYKVLCTEYICVHKKSKVVFSDVGQLDFRCNSKIMCNSGIDEDGCSKGNQGKATYRNCLRPSENALRRKYNIPLQWVKTEQWCDDRCDCPFSCFDESMCEGRVEHVYRCWNSDTRLPSFLLCNGENDCPESDDEMDCKKKVVRRCGKERLTASGLCYPWVLCPSKLDHVNCTDPAVRRLTCRINGYVSTLSRYVVCQGLLLGYQNTPLINDTLMCDDGIDGVCVSLSLTCTLHKHQLCDGNSDCQDSSDEIQPDCKALMEDRCRRRFTVDGRALRVPLAWIKDGVVDCTDGSDEEEGRWPVCPYRHFRRYVQHIDQCRDVYVCGREPRRYISNEMMCDTQDNSCEEEAAMCRAAEGTSDIGSEIVKVERRRKRGRLQRTYHIRHCLPGLGSLERFISPCTETEHPNYPILGVQRVTLRIPKQRQTCSSLYGAPYVYLACTDKCTDVTCPLAGPITDKSCPGQFLPPIYSLARRDFITRVRLERDGTFSSLDVFECQNRKCIPYRQVCNLADDCGDGSDERDCGNSFQCNVNITTANTKYVPWSRVCDGVYDCTDLSDECNRRCETSSMLGPGLVEVSWVMGGLAVGLNVLVMVRNIPHLVRLRSSKALINRSLLMLISLGDLLTGGYLIALATVHTHYGPKFCFIRREWLVSGMCSTLGAVNTFGSQVSLFAMATLSVYRVAGVRQTLRNDITMGTKSKVQLVMVIVVIIMSSLSMSLAPLLPAFEHIFSNAVYYPGNSLFKGFVTAPVMNRVIQEYYGRTRRSLDTISWNNRKALIRSMFTKEFGGIEEQILGFYGNDAVCLFKFFVTSRDPQSWFSRTVIGVNLVCFITIAISYTVVNGIVKSSSEDVLRQAPHTRLLHRRNKRLRRKVTMIITTDFLTWIPFTVLCLLHTTEVVDASASYALFSILILPINAIINPVIYDKLSEFVGKKILLCFKGNQGITEEGKEMYEMQEIPVPTTS